jgi:hypothetical protein
MDIKIEQAQTKMENWSKVFNADRTTIYLLHNCRWGASQYGKNIWSFWYKNLLFHKEKQDQKWSSGVPYCSLL